MFMSKNVKIIYNIYGKHNNKCSHAHSVRLRSSSEHKTKVYSHTILSPKTNFPARSNNSQKEEIVKLAQFSELYNWQRSNLKGKEFVLHDGPPYANGDLHMGHAVNKIIKDINNRNEILRGNKVHYVPGWDCHGLPIELKALQKAKKMTKNAKFTDPVQIRQLAREFAIETVNRQKKEFESWGVVADWDNKRYLTLDKSYVQNQLRQFYKMFVDKLVYRALKPVYWSPSSKTALAEAELEYDNQFKSREVYVTFPLKELPSKLRDAASGLNVSAIIWTTTPWTLVANRAVCYNPQLKYCLVTLSSRPGELHLVASSLIQELEKILGTEITRVAEVEGQELTGITYYNKLVNENLPFLAGDHVTEEKGTGLVHTAPAHGPDDFLVALRNNMKVECNVDEAGRYVNLDPGLNGLQVLSEGQDLVIQRLGTDLVYEGVHVHSYPLDWRTKKPVIIRASQQWFIDTAALKEKALAALDTVQILPPSSGEQSRQGFRAQLQKRPYWCISRQRAWGVPIPVLYRGSDVIVNERIIDRLCSLIEEKGSNVWWTCGVQDLMSEEVRNEVGCKYEDIEKGKDIMDIWFDSGISWSTLGGKKAHLYCEGYDQLTGWFQASLLTSLALTGEAPYESIFVHGFVVDDKKRKMSKSIGNVVEPATIIHGGKDRSQPPFGVDTLRWWVASHSTQHSQIVVSKKLLEDCQAEVIRMRSIIKYLLGVINDLKKDDFDKQIDLNYFDQFIVNSSHEFSNEICENYSDFRYNVAAQKVLHFISNNVSALYCHCIKDRLYCSPKNSSERLSAQLSAHTILYFLLKAIGPILPHLVEEAWLHHPIYKTPFYFTRDVPVLPARKIDAKIMEAVLAVKKDIFVLIKNETVKKFSVNIKLGEERLNEWKVLNECDGVNDSVLCEILEVSKVNLEVMKGLDKWIIDIKPSVGGQCLRCRKYNVYNDADKCIRCENVLNIQ